MTCKNCGAELPEDAKFCDKCGAAVGAETIAAEKPRSIAGKKKTILISAIAGVILIGGAGAAIGIISSNQPQSSQSVLAVGEKYLLDQKYEQAIIEFERVIKIDPMNAGAYLGLAEAYLGLGDTEKALEVLREGLEKTGDASLQVKIDELTKPVESSSSSSSSSISSSSSSSNEPVENREDEPIVIREYDRENRLVLEDVTSPDGTITDTEYGEYRDENDNVIGWGVMHKSVDRIDENGDYFSVSNYDYDFDGTLRNEKQYNDRGDIIKDVYYDDYGTNTITYKYEYGPFGVLSMVETEVTTYDGETNTSVYITNYTYDAGGKLISEIETETNGSRVSTTEYKYDANGRCIESHRQSFDRDGSLISDSTQTNKYNDAGRWIERNHVHLSKNHITKELTDEHIQIERRNDAGRIIEDTTRRIEDGQMEYEDIKTFSYDDKGRRSERKRIDKNPNETSVGTTTYSYIENGLVVHTTTTITYTDGSGREPRTHESIITWIYEYDELGRIILKTGYDEDGEFAGKKEYEY